MLAQRLAETATYIKTRYPKEVSLAIVLGSGLGEFADFLESPTVLDYADIPHFHVSGVAGHASRLVLGEAQPGFSVACLQGRFHFYEGHDMETVVYPMRLMHALGAKTAIVTNAAGGIRESFKPGTLMLIEDHLNLTGTNPLIGKNYDALGPRFHDMSEAYPAELRRLAASVAQREGILLESGVYAGLSGPSYETPAEIRMLRTLGADAVGMSTVPEVIAANHMGMRVLGISCITNPAAGVQPAHKLSHDEVMETSQRVKGQFISLLKGIVDELASQPTGAATPAAGSASV